MATEIVQIPNSKMRQRVIQQFIDIAAHCLKMNHLDGVLEIVGGLTHNSVERMKLTWNVCMKISKIWILCSISFL